MWLCKFGNRFLSKQSVRTCMTIVDVVPCPFGAFPSVVFKSLWKRFSMTWRTAVTPADCFCRPPLFFNTRKGCVESMSVPVHKAYRLPSVSSTSQWSLWCSWWLPPCTLTGCLHLGGEWWCLLQAKALPQAPHPPSLQRWHLLVLNPGCLYCHKEDSACALLHLVPYKMLLALHWGCCWIPSYFHRRAKQPQVILTQPVCQKVWCIWSLHMILLDVEHTFTTSNEADDRSLLLCFMHVDKVVAGIFNLEPTETRLCLL